MKYAYIGLGHLGRHLALNLRRAGYELAVYDLDRNAGEALVAAGARFASSPKDAATGADAVFTCLPSPAASRAVVAGPNGVLDGLAKGACWIEMSTNDRDEILALAETARAKGIATLEAPVTGGVHKAEEGAITVLVGGDAALYEKHRPAFDSMGGTVLHMGALGEAAIIKVITNMLAFIHLVATGEALMLAKRGGLDLAKSFAAIKASSGNSFVFETEGQLVLNGSYDIAFTMDLAQKDLGFALGFGRQFGVPLELAGLTEQIFRRATSQYGGGAWSTMVVKLLEDALATDLRAPGFPAKLTAE